MNNSRKIIHIDMDAFYASVEQLENPDLRGKPVAVGGNSERGVIAAASYEARVYGVRSAMSSKLAARMCPNLIFVRPDFAKYKYYSARIQAVFQRYTDCIEPLSLDEAFLDVTENKIGQRSATFIANAIKNEILSDTGLVASAGVSYCKFFAKLASDQDKPDGLYVIRPEDATGFIRELPVAKFFGVGRVTAEKMNRMGIFTGRDLFEFPEKELARYFGKSGSFLYRICRGIDERPVQAHRERKSIGTENTFSQDLFDKTSIEREAHHMLEALWKRYERFDRYGRTLTLKVKYADFTQITRNRTVSEPIGEKAQLYELAAFLVDGIFPLEKAIRLVGFQLSAFDDRELPAQTSLPI